MRKCICKDTYIVRGGLGYEYRKIHTEIAGSDAESEKAAYDFGNQEIEQEHLLYVLYQQDDSLIKKMIEKMEINTEHFFGTLENARRHV